MKRIIPASLLFLSTLCSACYHAGNVPPDNTAPIYDIFTNSYFNLIDSTGSAYIATDDSSFLFFNFLLNTGNPAAYPFYCYLSGLPAGVTTTPDSFSFRLNYNCEFHLYAASTSDTGIFPIYLCLNNTTLGLKKYQINLKVRQK